MTQSRAALLAMGIVAAYMAFVFLVFPLLVINVATPMVEDGTLSIGMLDGIINVVIYGLSAAFTGVVYVLRLRYANKLFAAVWSCLPVLLVALFFGWELLIASVAGGILAEAYLYHRSRRRRFPY